MSNALTPEQIIAAGRLMARAKAPFFRAGFLSFALRETDDPQIPLVATTHTAIFLWKRDAVAKITVEQMAGLFCHEWLHLWLETFKRTGERDSYLFNVAADICINQLCVEMGFELPPNGVSAKFFGFPEGQTAEWYYEKLLAAQPPKPKPQKGQGQQGGAGGQGGDDAEGEGDGEGDGAPSPGQGTKPGGTGGKGKPGGKGGAPGKPLPPKSVGAGHCGSCAGHAAGNEPAGDDADGRSEAQLRRTSKAVAEAIREAASKNPGSVPGGLVRIAELALEPPKVRWERQLHVAARAAVATRAGCGQRRYDGPSKKQAGVGYGRGRPILARWRYPIPRVAIAIDTSGSMSEGDLTLALRETAGVMKATGAEVEVCSCDVEVYGGLKKVKNIMDAAKMLTGGGGTDFRPVFAELKKARQATDILVFITDGYGPAPSEAPPGLQVIWLLVGKHTQTPAPWGKVIVCAD